MPKFPPDQGNPSYVYNDSYSIDSVQYLHCMWEVETVNVLHTI